MTTVFIAGSISISRLHEKVRERIGKIVSSKFNVVVGDAEGADASIQQCLHDYQASHVTVYCAGDTPRNNIAGWKVQQVRSRAPVGSRAFFTAKDLAMAKSSDYGLMVWDCKSTGTLSNVIELLKENKKSVVFVNKDKMFVTVAGKDDLTSLIELMSESARLQAEKKIGLSARIAALKQFSLGIDDRQSSSAQASHLSPALGVAEDRLVQSESMKLRLALISRIRDQVDRSKLGHLDVAKALRVAPSCISKLKEAEADALDLDTLVDMAGMAGLRVELQITEDISFPAENDQDEEG